MVRYCTEIWHSFGVLLTAIAPARRRLAAFAVLERLTPEREMSRASRYCHGNVDQDSKTRRKEGT